MNSFEKTVKFLAIFLAGIIIFTIFSGITFGLSFFARFYDDSSYVSEDYKEEFTDVSSLKIDTSFSNISISLGDTFLVEAKNTPGILVKQENGTLKINEKKIWGFHEDSSYIHITVPSMLQDLKIDSGAGKLEMDSISAEHLKLNQGAGLVSIRNSRFSNTDIDGGAGKIEILSSFLNQLDLDSGVGEVYISSMITGNSKIDCGIGHVNVEIPEAMDQYRLTLEKGIGSIYLNGDTVSNHQTFGISGHSLDIEGGIGRIDITFTK